MRPVQNRDQQRLVHRVVAMEVRIERGIDAITISMLLGEPMNISTITATSDAAITASRTTSHSDARTNADWSKVSATLRPLGATARISGMRARTASTTDSVDAAACLITSRKVAGRPSIRTTLLCG